MMPDFFKKTREQTCVPLDTRIPCVVDLWLSHVPATRFNWAKFSFLQRPSIERGVLLSQR